MSGAITLSMLASLLPSLSSASTLPSALFVGVAIAAPALAILGGCFLATFRTPSLATRSVIRHFTAGVMFAAAAAEVLPDLLHTRGAASAVRVVIGVALGVAAMVAIRAFSDWLKERLDARARERMDAPKASAASEGSDASKASKALQAQTQRPLDVAEESAAAMADPPVSLIAVTTVDVLLDGITLGIVFSLGARQGLLIALALAIEVFFLGVSIGGDLTQARISRARALALSGIPAIALTGAAVAGVTLLAGLPAAVVEVLIAAGLVALLYLATEELLKEAHEVPETALTTAIFFVGFLVIVLFDLLTSGVGT